MNAGTRMAAMVVAFALLASGAAQAREDWSPRLQRRVVEALTPQQAAAFADGADPAGIVVGDGKTLEQVLTEAVAASGAQLAYTPVDPCPLVHTTRAAAGRLAAGESRAFRAPWRPSGCWRHGASNAGHATSTTGC